jgi:hypothetical protein
MKSSTAAQNEEAAVSCCSCEHTTLKTYLKKELVDKPSEADVLAAPRFQEAS